MKNSRCIVLYASINEDTFNDVITYGDRLLSIINDLKDENYKGDVIYRIGGYPLLDKGGIRFAHIPYSFKVLSLIEASHLGYDEILWLDCSVHPTNDLNHVFDEINKRGFFLLSNGICLNFDYNFGTLPDYTLESWGVKKQDLSNVPHIIAPIIGVSFKSPVAHRFINEWYRLTSMVCPSISLYPEEFLISVAAWRSSIQSTGHYSQFMDMRSITKIKPHKVKRPFWFDKS